MKQVSLIESGSGKYYYIDEYTNSKGFWLSIKEFTTEDEASMDSMGWLSYGIRVSDINGPYYRSVLPFMFWKINPVKDKNHSPVKIKISKYDKRALDYKSHADNEGIIPLRRNVFSRLKRIINRWMTI